eukprot:TRINITY_DN12361_c0_g1_i2.p1 TRINITY_DN12361_c0_g1~~TRINITY_DN12361_c0_g1_i2.p1  ORF type:complete len:410 (-),score=89.04 TRINITY_DN12361_c0_g1_i2:126-1355(-)
MGAVKSCELPLVDAAEETPEDDDRCCCLRAFGCRHTRDVEAAGGPEAVLDVPVKVVSDQVLIPERGSPKRDVNVSFPSLKEIEAAHAAEVESSAADTQRSAASEGGFASNSPASSSSSAPPPLAAGESCSSGVAVASQAGEAPAAVQAWARAATQAASAACSSSAGSSSQSRHPEPWEVAGLPLDRFWQKLADAEARGGKEGSAMARAEKFLSFRQRFCWPLTISAKQVDQALASRAHVYLPPRRPGEKPLLVFCTDKVDTRLCTMEEYQKLTMFMLEAAFRETDADGVMIVLDVRGLSSALGQALLSGYTDVKRGIAMASGGFPVKVAHVQLIEDEDGARLARMALGLVISKLSSKLRARVHRGGPRAALDALGGDMLPIFLGGLRDSDSEFSAWLQQLRPTAPQSTA